MKARSGVELNNHASVSPLSQVEGRNPAQILEARGGIEPPMKVLQTFALPLGDRASVAQPLRAALISTT
jgi:hypothetical protein